MVVQQLRLLRRKLQRRRHGPGGTEFVQFPCHGRRVVRRTTSGGYKVHLTK